VKRVFILSSGSIFGQGVQCLLSRKAGLDIVGYETDWDTAVNRIRELQPDVVMLDQDRWPGELAVELMSLREQGAGIRVIGLSLQANSLSCYSKETLGVQRVEDLMEAIEQSGR
jgi:chemotaxis response regulator CheB